MNKPHQASFTQLHWPAIQDEMRASNPQLAAIIDDLQTKNAFPIYKVRYPFGSHIIQAGHFHFPLPDGTLAPITDSRHAESVRNDLGYHGGRIPLGMVLNHSVELYMQTEDRVIPFNLIRAGKLIGLWLALSPHTWPQVWHMTSGARSIFVLPKITDTVSHKKLCRARDIKMPLPRDLVMHGSLLSGMANHSEFSEPWYTDVLFFSKDWLKNQKNDSWIRFHYYLYQEGWAVTEYLLRKVVYDHIWDQLMRELTKYDIKATPFIIEIVKYIVMVGLGAVPGFSPAINDEEAPITGLQQDLLKIYGLKHYAPTIMVPHHFASHDKRPVYWSLAMPTHFESTVKPKTLTSTLVTLREIRELMLYFKQTLLKNLEVKDSLSAEFVERVAFDFFHSEPDIEGKIRLSLEMPKEDNALTYCAVRSQQRYFSDVSPFVRGCVRFSAL